MKALKLTICYVFVATIMALTLTGGKAHATSEHNSTGGTQLQDQGQLQGQLQGQGQLQQAYGGKGGHGGNANAGAFSGSESTAESVGVGTGYGGSGFAAGGNALGLSSSGDSTSNATSGNSGAQSSQSITLNQNHPATDLSRGVGTAIAPALANNFITCSQSTSVGAGFMGGAFSVGSSYQDVPCNRRQSAMMLNSLGDTEAARAVMCADEDVREAYKSIGNPCPKDMPKLTSEQARLNSKARMELLAKQYAEKSIK